MFRMGYKDTGFAGHWDHMAEQLILCPVAGSSTYPTDTPLYNTVMAVESQYKGGYLSSSDPSLNVEPSITHITAYYSNINLVKLLLILEI